MLQTKENLTDLTSETELPSIVGAVTIYLYIVALNGVKCCCNCDSHQLVLSPIVCLY